MVARDLEYLHDRPALQTTIINALFESIQKLEKYMIIDVPLQVLTEVANVISWAAKMGVKVNWMDETLGKIASKKEHVDLMKRSRDLIKELEQLDRRRDGITQILAEIGTELCIIILVFNMPTVIL